MPHLAAFLREGSLFDNDHTVLTAYTGPDAVSFLSGTYPDKSGITHNHFFVGKSRVSRWAYWESDLYLDRDRRTARPSIQRPYVWTQPPWQQFNDHGWDVGVVRATDMALEDESEVRRYGVMNDSDQHAKDYRFYAIHCAPDSPNCTSSGMPSDSVFGVPNIAWLQNVPLLDNTGTVAWQRNSSLDAMSALSATYAMQVRGIPVTYTYIPAGHHKFTRNSRDYLASLRTSDRAFQLFFDRLATVGFTASNTLFMLTSDEGDLYYPHPPGRYDLLRQLSARSRDCMHGRLRIAEGSAALLYVNGSRCRASVLRTLRSSGGWRYLADRSAMVAARMVRTPDPVRQREPTFALFGTTSVWWVDSGRAATGRDIARFNAPMQWTHGTIDPSINRTWLALVGPGVARHRVSTFIDHVDALPTLRFLLRYPLSRALDGRVLFEALAPSRRPSTIRLEHALLLQLAPAFKSLSAPLGAFARAALDESTLAAQRGAPVGPRQDDARWLELTRRRNVLASELQAMVNRTVEGEPLDRNRAARLLRDAHSLLLTVRRDR
jgi:hypothetical protein